MTSISKSSELNLNRLVHLALNSSPQVGIVNFNLLKTFLLELLKALNLQQFEPKFGEDSDINTLVNDAIQSEADHEKYVNLLSEKNDKKDSKSDGSDSKSAFSLLTSDLKPLSFERFKKLEDKLARFEQQMAALNSLPSNQQIIDRSKDSKSGHILEIWQYTQLSKRLESNEEGITKLTSLVQDLINEINELRENQSRNDGDIKKLNDKYNELLNRINAVDKTIKSLPSSDQLKDLENELETLKKFIGKIDKFDDRLGDIMDQIKAIESKIVNVVTHPDLDLYVTWPSLENSLKGLKEALDTAMKREPVVNEETQTVYIREKSAKAKTPLPPPTPQPTDTSKQSASEKVALNEQNYIRTKTPSTVSQSRPSSHHPSKELQEILSKLGTLNERHEQLKDIVDQIRLELNRKPSNQSSQQSFKLPDDFAEKIDEIRDFKSILEDLKKKFNDETNKRFELEGLIANLNNSLDNIRDSLKECLKNTQLNKEDIMSLKEAIRMLDETKADKDWVRSEFERKADKRDLDQKVNKKTFDENFNEISHSVNDCKQKTDNLEEEFRKGNESIFKELENKLDRLELDGLKDQIEKQLKKLRKMQKESIQPVQVPMMNAEDDAAGLRKQLLRFHCISCDRPIDMTSGQVPIPALPAERGMRPIQTPRPYTTYELDQIRQFQKQQFLTEHNYDLFATVRQCGGSHTLTVPNKKLVKVNNPLVEESVSQPIVTQRSEVQLQGQDGHIYKGRIDARLPVEMRRQYKTSNQKNPLNNSYQNLRSVSDKENQDENPGDKLPVFTN
ncbi:glutamine-rich 2-like isoform X4 [Brachionus plicatilis]|uniref:Glutamine-rich 2-like isoform X4 n=1 Tax=Brachionus plicatilis TaxID=10195 RepID=A0A3M7S7P7_BRAPC|nr:glutamine-rich 2-like isoform X4 [Brachionus plicatilis]